MRGQAYSYVQCHFCNSMVDLDVLFVQVYLSFFVTQSVINVAALIRTISSIYFRLKLFFASAFRWQHQSLIQIIS